MNIRYRFDYNSFRWLLDCSDNGIELVLTSEFHCDATDAPQWTYIWIECRCDLSCCGFLHIRLSLSAIFPLSLFFSVVRWRPTLLSQRISVRPPKYLSHICSPFYHFLPFQFFIWTHLLKLLLRSCFVLIWANIALIYEHYINVNSLKFFDWYQNLWKGPRWTSLLEHTSFCLWTFARRGSARLRSASIIFHHTFRIKIISFRGDSFTFDSKNANKRSDQPNSYQLLYCYLCFSYSAEKLVSSCSILVLQCYSFFLIILDCIGSQLSVFVYILRALLQKCDRFMQSIYCTTSKNEMKEGLYFAIMVAIMIYTFHLVNLRGSKWLKRVILFA